MLAVALMAGLIAGWCFAACPQQMVLAGLVITGSEIIVLCFQNLNWWVKLRPPQEIFKSHASFLYCELSFYLLGFLTFVHGKSAFIIRHKHAYETN